MDLGVTMLTSLGSGHFNNLTRSTLDTDMTVLSQGRTLHGESKRGTGLSGLEGVIVVVFGHTMIGRFDLVYTNTYKIKKKLT